MSLSDSEGYDLADHSWTEVGASGRKRRRGRMGAAGRQQQDRLREIPGALGLLSGAHDRRNQSQHQQQPQDRYPKIVSRRTDFAN